MKLMKRETFWSLIVLAVVVAACIYSVAHGSEPDDCECCRELEEFKANFYDAENDLWLWERVESVENDVFNHMQLFLLQNTVNIDLQNQIDQCCYTIKTVDEPL